MKNTIRWRYLGLFILLCDALTAQSRDSFTRIANILPARTFFLAGVPRPMEALQQLSSSNLGQIWAEVEVQEWLQSLIEKSFPAPFTDLESLIRQFKKIPGSFDQGIYLATFWAGPENNHGGSFQKILLLQSSNAETLQQFCTLVEEKLLEWRPDRVSSKSIVKRRTQNEVQWSEILLPRNTYFYGSVGTTFVLGHQREIVLNILARLQQQTISDPSVLSQDPSFLEANTLVSHQENELFWAYFDLEKMLREAPTPTEWSFFSLLLGLEKMKMFATASQIVSGRLADQSVVRFKDSSHWISSVTPEQKNSWASADICPASTVFFASFKLNPSSLMITLREDLNTSLGEHRMEEFLHQFKQRFQFSLIEDFLVLLGEEISVFVALPQYGFLPQAGMLFLLKDPERFFQLIEKIIANQSQYTLESLDYLNQRLYYLTEKYDSFPRWNPAFTYLQGHLILSYNVTSLKAIVKAKQNKDKSLMTSDAWKNALQKSSQPHHALWYMNSQQIFVAFYEIFTQITSVISLRDLPFHPLLLPDTETLAQHLETSCTFIDYHPKEMRTTSFGDGFFPSTWVLTYFGFLTGDFLWQFYEQVSQVEKEIYWHLEGYSHLLVTSAFENQPAQWVRNLNEVFKQNEMAPWISPFDPEAISDNINYCSYEYFPEQATLSLPVSNRWDSPSFKYYVLYDKKPFYNGGRFVLLTNRTVQFIPEEEFQRELQKQIQEFKR